MLRKSLHVERFNYHVTTQPTTETARHAFLTARTQHSTRTQTRHESHDTGTRDARARMRHSLRLITAVPASTQPAAATAVGLDAAILTSGARAAKSLGMTRHLPGRGCGGSTERWRAAGAGLVCGTAGYHREALSARSRASCECARPTLSQLHLGKQAGTGAQSTFEADGRSPEPHLWRPLASRMSHE